jgi:hypothetical protein
VDLGATIFLITFALLITFGISGLLIRQLSRVMNVYLQSHVKEESGQPELGERQRPQIEAAREVVVPSVTEHTTRSFEPVYEERNTR